ncbi:MAG TPA: hypothetical protein VN736_26660 [Candidatus Limnocylindrales bacterium]|nr:hypothetical protein [Candidatus Limnocylindrales bacterium]
MKSTSYRYLTVAAPLAGSSTYRAVTVSERQKVHRKVFILLALAAAAVHAAVTGTVVNGTTGKPQANTTVTLYKFGQGGMEPLAKAQTDSNGAFSFPQDTSQNPGPAMVRVELDGVTYNHMMPPGTPTTGFNMMVYNATRQQPAAAKVSKHMLLFEPANGQMVVNETFLFNNPTKTTWTDSQNGTLHFFLPASAKDQADVKATAPDGMPVPVPTEKLGKGEIEAAKFEVKPGETRFDITYTVPYTEGEPFTGKIFTQDDNTYLISPAGVTMKAGDLADLGTEPRTQAHIYGLTGKTYTIQLTGAEVAPPEQPAADSDSNSGPQIEQIMPRLYSKAKLIIVLAMGILALGFVLLYRKGEA